MECWPVKTLIVAGWQRLASVRYSLDLPGACGRIGSKTGYPADGRAARTGRAASTTCRAAARPDPIKGRWNMAKTKRTPTPADESPANDDAKYAALQREFAELGQQIAQTKTNWEDQAEADDAKKLLDRHKALAHRLYRPPTPADLIGKFFRDAYTTLTFADARPIRPFIHCVKGDPGYSAEQKSLDDYRDKMADHGWKTEGFLKLLHEDADRLADALASIGEDCKPVLEFCQMIPVGPGSHFLFETAPVWAKLRELYPWLDSIRRRLVANAPLPAEDVKAGATEALAGDVTQADDGSPFYKPSYFQTWGIGDELLRRNSTDKKKYVEGKVRRLKKKPSTGKGKRAVYWYSEPDTRKCWPDKFATVENQSAKA